MYMILADIDAGPFVDTAVVDIESFVAEPTFVGIELLVVELFVVESFVESVVDTSPAEPQFADTDHI